jgi:hypothetical protein
MAKTGMHIRSSPRLVPKIVIATTRNVKKNLMGRKTAASRFEFRSLISMADLQAARARPKGTRQA